MIKRTSIGRLAILCMIAAVYGCAGNTSSKLTVETEPGSDIDSITVVSLIDGLTRYAITPNIALTSEPVRNEYVMLVSSAAFTGPDGKIVGHYYSSMDGQYGRNPKDRNVTGGFIARPYNPSSPSAWDFYMGGYEQELEQSVKNGTVSAAFAQNVIIYKGVPQDTGWRHNDIFQYRALCEISSSLYIIESEKQMPYDQFVLALVDQKVANAIYLDMATYNYLWYASEIDLSDGVDTSSATEFKGANYDKVSNFINVYIVN